MNNIIKSWGFSIGFILIVIVAFIFVSSTNDKLANNPDYLKIQSLTDDSYLPEGIRDEVVRTPQKSQVAIVGYDKRMDMPTRTLVMFNGEPVLLKRVLTKADTANELDLVRMADDRVFICLHERNDKCWLADSLSDTPGMK